MQEFVLAYKEFIILAIIWTIPWKIIALWKAARRGQKLWFVFLFILNTLALLEIVYIFYFSRKKKSSHYNYQENFSDNSAYVKRNGNNGRNVLIKGL